MSNRQNSTSQAPEPGTAPSTFAFEESLPRVPLPTPEASCERFLSWCAPLLTPDELAETEAEAAAFLRPGGPGRVLHAALEEYEATEGVRSWLDAFWPYRYLGRRDRIALNANFFFLFQDGGEGQVPRAAGLIAGALHHKGLLDREQLPPVMQRGVPQSMAQNTFLYSTTRIPGVRQDTVRAPCRARGSQGAHGPCGEDLPGPSDARHIVVFFRGRMFRLDVLGADGVPYGLRDLEAGLHAVMKAGAEPAAPGTSVGHLTTLARAEWAAAREDLLRVDPRNAESLDIVETALFCVCLEDFAPAGVQEACDELLYGDRGNRWFDKAVSFVVFADGRAGINVEHCELDGTTILGFTDFLLGTPAEEHSLRSGARSRGLPALEPVVFALDARLRERVRAAAESFAAYGDATATTTVTFPDFGSTTAKSLGMSPDAFVQCAYQLAHQRAKGLLGATYESIATRQYRNGRTEAMRVVTPEMRMFVAAMEDPATPPAGRLAAFRAAAEAHVARAKAAQAGQVPEQHLWELELLQRRRGPELGVAEQPALYRTPGWLKMRDDYLSTSSAPSRHIRFFGFGSTSSRCIGVAYVLLPERFNLYLSTPMPVADRMHAFADRLREAVAELRHLLESGGGGTRG
ncbi:choline/carnitine O-acyltransferase [Streptomyces pacificus]|uniref:Choline/carnitine O-acyltransferase n=1 Tax=Streptomyces pacificus TaxID=2705029 RepID=A0A6A0AQ62_9ACTN|nr:choline/carnitine O-acyltransferase [Streptomyces pacificus]GFH34992.1 choline/carnitine O-acyltransferase [Streptomyces pacificus]